MLRLASTPETEVDNVTVRNLREADLERAVAICNEQLGDGYFPDNYALTSFDYGLFVDGELASVLIITPNDAATANKTVGFDRFTESVLFVKTMATADKFKRKGYGTQLLRQAMSELPVMPAYGMGWESKAGINIEFVFRRCGFTKEKEIKLYYASLNNCPDCGNDTPCQCTAWLFVKSLSLPRAAK